MKKIVLLIVFCFIALNLNGQSQYGVFAGVNFGALAGPINEGDKGAPGIGPNFGLYANYKLGEHIYLQPSVMYSCTGLKFTATRYDEEIEQEWNGFKLPTYVKQATADGTLKMNYIEMPVSVLWQISKRIGLNFGGRAAYMFKGSLTGNAYDVILGENAISDDPIEYDFDESSALKKWDFGLVLGTQVRLSPKLAARLQFHGGLTPMNDKNSSAFPDNYYNLYMSTSLAYNIFGSYY